MVFVEPAFVFIFLPATLILYALACLTKNGRVKNLCLLFCSLVFYSWGGIKYTVLLMISTAVNYLFGLLLEKENHKKTVLIFSVLYNVGILFVFKYLNFFGNMALGLIRLGKPDFELTIPEITLPIGISFFTFQIMSYVFDVYRGNVKAQKNIFDLALYIMLFPQLIAGPIVRYSDVEKEIADRRGSPEMIRYGAERFMAGFAKKILLANRMGYTADQIFSRIGELNTPYAWMGALCYALQIYLDFSSYSDMAIGLGRIFGFHFLENFDYPYRSESIREFWRRWHISLSGWFRDYVYIPLGGNRKGKAKTCRNLLIVFLLTGIWHGADWTFVVWGLFHGFFLVLERGRFGKFLDRLPRFIRHIYTIAVVLTGWVFFRCDTLTDAFTYLKAMFGARFSGYGLLGILESFNPEFLVTFSVSLVISLPLAPALKKRLAGSETAAWVADLALIAVFAFSVCYMTGTDFNPFIYFRF